MAPKSAFQMMQARAAAKAGANRGTGPVLTPIADAVNLNAEPINTVAADEVEIRPLVRKNKKRTFEKPPLADKGKEISGASTHGGKKSKTKKTAPFNCKEFMNTKAEDFKIDPFRTSLAVFTRMTDLVDDMRSDANKQIADAKREADVARKDLEKVKADLTTSENEKINLKKEADQKIQELKDQLTSVQEKAAKDAEDLEMLKKELAELKSTSTLVPSSELQNKISQLEEEVAEAYQLGSEGLASTFNNALAQVAVFRPGFVADQNILKPEYTVVEDKIVLLDAETGQVVKTIFPVED